MNIYLELLGVECQYSGGTCHPLERRFFPATIWQRSACQAPHLVTRGQWSRLEGPLFYTGGNQSPEVIHPLLKALERVLASMSLVSWSVTLLTVLRV